MAKLVIGVMTTLCNEKYKTQTQACLDTWANNLPAEVKVFFFAGYLKDPNFPNIIHLDGVQEDYASAFHKQFGGLKWLYENIKSDYYMIVGTDTYIAIARLLRMLYKYDFSQNLYIGGHGAMRLLDNENVYFHSGGAGFIITHSVLKLVVENYVEITTTWKDICSRNNDLGWVCACDLTIAYWVHKWKIQSSKEEGFFGCDTKGLCNGEPCKMIPNQICANKIEPYKIITCHYMDPDAMRAYHNLYTQSEITFVTCLYDLASREASGRYRRSTDEYLKLGEFVYKINRNIIFYTEIKYVDYIWRRRKAYGLLEKTLIIPKPFEDLPYYKLYPDVVWARQLHPMKNGVSHKDTPYYTVLTVSKLSLVFESIKSNPFNSLYFGWLDFGIGHVAYPDSLALKKGGIFFGDGAPIYDTVRLPLMQYFNADTFKDPDYKVMFIGLTAAGLITGSSKNLEAFCECCDVEFRKNLIEGYALSEEKLFPIVALQIPEKVSYSFTVYEAILDNYYEINRGISYVVSNVIYCLNIGELGMCNTIAEELYRAHLESRISLTRYESTQTLCCILLTSRNIERKRIIAKEIARLIGMDHEIRFHIQAYLGRIKPIYQELNEQLMT